MRAEDIFPSKYLKHSDLDGKARVATIVRDTMEELRSERGVENKLVLYFKEIDKGLVCNRTNFDVMAEFLGPDTEDWLGKQVVLYPDRVAFGNKRVDAIRVRAPKKQAAESNHTVTQRNNYELSSGNGLPAADDLDDFR